MFRDNAAAVNAASPPPPTVIDRPPVVNPAHRWRCPACRKLYRHPWILAVHLAAPDASAARSGHGQTELDAWTTVATLVPIVVAPAQARRAVVPLAASAA